MERDNATSFAQGQRICYCCGKSTHLSPECPDRNKPKSEWYINRALQNMQDNNNNNNENNNQDDDCSTVSTNSCRSKTTNNNDNNNENDNIGWSSYQSVQKTNESLVNKKNERRYI